MYEDSSDAALSSSLGCSCSRSSPDWLLAVLFLENNFSCQQSRSSSLVIPRISFMRPKTRNLFHATLNYKRLLSTKVTSFLQRAYEKLIF